MLYCAKLYLNKTNIFLKEPQEGIDITSLYFTGNKPNVLKCKLLLVINCKPPDKNRTFLQYYIHLDRNNLMWLFYLLSLQTKAGGNVTSNLV